MTQKERKEELADSITWQCAGLIREAFCSRCPELITDRGFADCGYDIGEEGCAKHRAFNHVKACIDDFASLLADEEKAIPADEINEVIVEEYRHNGLPHCTGMPFCKI